MAFLVEMDLNGTQLVDDAPNWPLIRLFTTRMLQSDVPLQEQPLVEEAWAKASRQSISQNINVSLDPTNASLGDSLDWRYFSAVCWLFGRALHQSTGGIPIGLVSASWSGSPIEFWSGPEALQECQSSQALSEYPNSYAWNGMISPLLNTTIKGAVWYQGENNIGDEWTYRNGSVDYLPTYACRLPAMIENWRRAWSMGTQGQTDAVFPFGVVQLAPWKNDGFGSVGIRWAQTAGYGVLPNARMPRTFMAVTIDLYDPDNPYGDVHIRDKQEVGHRLALAARAIAYLESGVAFTGPVPIAATTHTLAGSVIMRFANTSALDVRDGTVGWEVCSLHPCALNNSDNWQSATATLSLGSSSWPMSASTTNSTKRKVASTLSSSAEAASSFSALSLSITADSTPQRQVSRVRYAWSSVPCQTRRCGVYGLHDGLPLAPFVFQVD